VIEAGCDVLDLGPSELLDALGGEVVLLVAVSKRPNFLSVHPVEHAGLAAVAPGVDTPIFRQRYCVIFSESHIDHSLISLHEVVNELRIIETSVCLCALTQHSPIAASEKV
jgi:hypothetical protein